MLRAVVASAALLFVTCTLVLCLFAGNAWRYEAEFLPSLGLLSVIGIFGLERALANRPALRIAARAAWSLLLAFSIAFNLLESIKGRAEQITQHALRLMVAHQMPDAIVQFEASLRLAPDDAEAHNDLAIALALSDRPTEALAHLREAVRLKPDYYAAHNDLGNALFNSGQVPEALAQYQEALRLRPDFPQAHNNLGAALASVGRWPEAILHYREALRLKPDYSEARDNLKLAQQAMGRNQKATATKK